MNEDLLALLAADAGVLALVGDRISWGLVPQGSTDPAIAMHEISSLPTYTMEGQVDLVPVRVQIDARGLTFHSAMTVARAVRAKLSGFSGTEGGTEFLGIFQVSGRTLFEKAGDRVYHTVSTDFEIHSRSL